MQQTLDDHVSIGAERFDRVSTTPGEPSALGFDVGAIVKLASNQNLLVSAGRGLTHADADRAPIYLAWQLEQ